MDRGAFLAIGFIAAAAALAALAKPKTDDGRVRTLAGGPFEASGATQAPGGGVLFVDDSRPDTVLWMSLGADGAPQAAPVAIPMGATISDPEGITSDGTHVYVVGSQSRGKHAGLVRFRFDAKSRRAEDAATIADLDSLLAGKAPALREGDRKAAALNIEGLAWDAKGRRLLLGLRAPLDANHALVVPLRLRDPRGAFADANLEVGSPIRVDLGGSGIRSIEADGTGSYLIIAGGVTDAGTSRLVRWDGRGSGVQLVATLPRHLKPEGVVRTRVGSKDMTLVLCDSSRYLLMD